jgi:hypothetical protein
MKKEKNKALKSWKKNNAKEIHGSFQVNLAYRAMFRASWFPHPCL